MPLFLHERDAHEDFAATIAECTARSVIEIKIAATETAKRFFRLAIAE